MRPIDSANLSVVIGYPNYIQATQLDDGSIQFRIRPSGAHLSFKTTVTVTEAKRFAQDLLDGLNALESQ